MNFKITKIIIAICAVQLCCTPLLKAQTVSTVYATQINSAFAGVDKSKVPHQLLKDYAMEFTELAAYNGVLTDTNYVQKSAFKSIYNTLFMARVQPVPSLIDPANFNTNWDNLRAKNKIVLSGLYYKYSKLKDNAYPNFITVSNNKLYDKYINGVWQNPYETKSVFAIAAPITIYKSLTVDVELPASLWYTNQSNTVQSIAIDFGDGNGYQTMTFGQTKTVTYNQPDVYDWRYKLTLNNNQVLYSQSKLIITKSAPTSSWSGQTQY